MTTEAGKRHALIATLVVAISSALVLIGIELVLRWNGYLPWRVARLDANEPTIHIPDGRPFRARDQE